MTNAEMTSTTSVTQTCIPAWFIGNPNKASDYILQQNFFFFLCFRNHLSFSSVIFRGFMQGILVVVFFPAEVAVMGRCQTMLVGSKPATSSAIEFAAVLSFTCGRLERKFTCNTL